MARHETAISVLETTLYIYQTQERELASIPDSASRIETLRAYQADMRNAIDVLSKDAGKE
jgi:hypothetical protein